MKKERDLYNVAMKLFLKNKRGEILGLKAKTGGGPLSGFYDVPGGRIDTDEFQKPIAEIIARETQEELGKISYELNPRPVALGRHLVPKKFTTSLFYGRAFFRCAAEWWTLRPWFKTATSF